MTKYPERGVDTPNQIITNTKPIAHACEGLYTVVYGDTLSDIAHRCNLKMNALARANKILPPYSIYVGQSLNLRNVQSLPLSDKAQNKTSAFSPAPFTRTQPDVKKIADVKWQWPTSRKLAHRFISDNAGLSVLEVYGLPGQSITAVGSGKVVYASNGIVNFGWMIVIKHDNDFMSIYAHNSALLVKEGDRVKARQKIALLGATGNTSKSKLYLEARYQGKKIDIKKVLK